MQQQSLKITVAAALLLGLCFAPSLVATTPTHAATRTIGNGLNAAASVEIRRLVFSLTGARQPLLPYHAGPVTSVIFSPGGGLIATASYNESAGTGTDDHSIRLWSVRTGRLIAALRGHPNPVQALAFSPDGRLLASASTDGTIRLWNVNRRRLWIVLRASKSSLNTVAFDPTGKMLVSGGDDQAVRFWTLRSVRLRRTVQTLSSDDGHVISVLHYSPDGRMLAVGMSTIQGAREDSYDGSIELWNARTGRKLVTLPGSLGAIGSIAFSPDGRLLGTGEYQERGRTGLEMQENTPSGADHGIVRLWQTRTGKPIATFLKHLAWYPYVTFSNRTLMSAVGLGTGAVEFWREGGPKTTIGRHGSPIRSVAFSPGGSVLAAGREDGTVWIHRLSRR